MSRVVCDPSSGSKELCLTEIIRSGSQMFFVCFVGDWQRNFEPVCVCVCVCARARVCVRKVRLLGEIFCCNDSSTFTTWEVVYKIKIITWNRKPLMRFYVCL